MLSRYRGTLIVAATLPAALQAQRPAVWRLTPEVVLGGHAPDHVGFNRVLGIVPAKNGLVFVADARAQEISVFDAAGTYRQTIGRQGGGPGEFVRLHSFGLIGDTLWAVDGNLRRTTLFSLEGAVLATISRDPGVTSESTTAGGASARVTAVLPGGLAFAEGVRSAVDGLSGPEMATTVLRATRSGRALGTLASVPTTHTRISFTTDGVISFATQRFSDAALTVLAPLASRLFVVDRSVARDSRNAAFEITAIDASGDTAWKRRYPYVPRRLEKAVADSFLSSMERSFRRSGRTAAEIRRAAFIPRFRPPVSGGFASTDGLLWLRREEGRTTVEYLVIRPDGVPIATTAVPRNVTIMAAVGPKVWGVELDADDVPRVVRYAIER